MCIKKRIDSCFVCFLLFGYRMMLNYDVGGFSYVGEIELRVIDDDELTDYKCLQHEYR